MEQHTKSARLVIWCIVLAAGASSRMGRQKLTLPLEDGVPMVRRVLEHARMGLQSVEGVETRMVVVISSRDEGVAKVTADETCRQLLNPNAGSGMSSSLQVGVRDAMAHSANAVLVLLGDQPGVLPHHLASVVSRYRDVSCRIVQAAYNGHPSHPVLFDASLFTQLLEVSGDEGGRKVVKDHQGERELVHFEEDVPVDIDTADAYHKWLSDFESTSDSK